MWVIVSLRQTVDSTIEAVTFAQNEQQQVDISTKETTSDSPLHIQKTTSLKEIYEQAPLSDEHLQFALFSSQPTIFEEEMKDSQWVHANEEVNENDEVATID